MRIAWIQLSTQGPGNIPVLRWKMEKFDAKAVVKQVQRKTIKKELYFRKLLDSIRQAVIIIDKQGQIKLFNQAAVEMWGLIANDLRHSLEDMPFFSQQIQEKIQDTLLNRKKNELPECSFTLPSGDQRFMRMDFAPLTDELNGIVEVILTGTDITKEKQLEQEKKILEGLLPICSHCKKIRDKTQEWVVLEQYIDDHSSARFSHSICPDCVNKYYPDT
jgi:PAS domain S-box-containing protein